jgi:hypothetical protein
MVNPSIRNERHLIFDWGAFLGKLSALPEPLTKDTERAKAAVELLDRIMSQDFSYDYLVSLSDSTFTTAWELIQDQGSDSPVIEQAHFMVDEEAWDHLVSRIEMLEPQCDPSIGEVFI